jgi:hypothetical protein
MPDNPNPTLPYAVRAREAQRLAGIGHNLLWKRLNEGIYQSFLDGVNRMVVTHTIIDHQKRLAKEQAGTPKTKPSKRNPQKRT